MGVFKEHQESLQNCVTSGGMLSAGAMTIANGGQNLTNSTTLARTCSAQLSTASGQTAPGASVTYFIALYLVPKVDGTNISTIDTSTPSPSPNYFAGNLYWQGGSGGSGTEYLSCDLIELNPIDYVPYILNNLGVTLASGWSLTFQPGDDQY